jgi:hypothetical protein
VTDDDDDDDSSGGGGDVIYIPTLPVSGASMLDFCEIVVGNFLDFVLCQCADYIGRLVLP